MEGPLLVSGIPDREAEAPPAGSCVQRR